MPRTERVIIVTGASSGIGNAIATLLAKRGHRVFGTSRQPARHERRADEFFELLPLDLESVDSAAGLAREVLDRAGRIDALVCNAGMGISGPFEECSLEEMRRQMEVNFFGVLACVKAVIPSMRERGSGRVVVVSSIAGRAGLPFQSLYAASKHALEGLVESLRGELRPFGIELCLVEPGHFRTGFTTARQRAAAFDPALSPYAAAFERAMAVQVRAEEGGADPLVAAHLVERVLAARRPAVRYTTGPLVERLGILLKPFIPARLFEALFAAYYRLDGFPAERKS